MKHLYIIEDNIGILDSLSFLFEKKYKVTCISDARIALSQLRSERPDLILLDLLMPDFDGTAFIKAFAQRQLKIPILLMTADANANEQLKHRNVTGIIRKPFQMEEMETKIEQALTRVETF